MGKSNHPGIEAPTQATVPWISIGLAVQRGTAPSYTGPPMLLFGDVRPL